MASTGKTGRQKRGDGRIRPTARCMTLMLAAICLALLGADLGAGELVAAAMTALAAIVAGLICAHLHREPLAARDEGLLAWERIDRRGKVVERTRSARAPNRRGVWRRTGHIVWRDALRLWEAPGTEATGRELVVPPRPCRRRPAREALHGSPIRSEADPEIASVRRYEPGDPLRQVAWRASAHHGRLMSYELRGSEAKAALIVVDAASGQDADAIASTAWRLAQELRGQARPIVTDGVQSCEGQDAARLLALFETQDGQRSASERLGELTRLARRLSGLGGWHVLLVSDVRGGELERELRRSTIGSKSELMLARHEASPDEDGAEREPEANPRSDLARRLAVCACCLACLGVAFWQVAQLVAPAAWTPCCAVVLTGATIAATLPPQRRVVARTLLGALLCLVATFAAGLWLTLSQAGALPSSLAGTRLGAGFSSAGELGALVGLAQKGLNELWLQWVPLNASSVRAGIACVAAGGALAAALRLVLAAQPTRPLVALVALAATAACSQLLGTSDANASVLVACACGLVLVGLIPARGTDSHAATGEPPSDERGPSGQPKATASKATRPRARAKSGVARGASHGVGAHTPNGTAATRLVSAATVVLACAIGMLLASPASLLLARSGISLGLGGGSFLGTSTVNPLVDLSNNLRENSGDAAFLYTTSYDGPIYLRLATLDDFDGSTWSITDEAGSAAALPGAFTDGSPLTSRDSSGGLERISTTVSLRTLASAFAPAPTNSTAADAEGGITGSWTWTADGCLHATNGRTQASMSYTVTGIYLRPISSEQAFSQLNEALSESSAQKTSEVDLSRYLSVEGELAESVLGVIAEAQAAGIGATANGSATGSDNAEATTSGESSAGGSASSGLVDGAVSSSGGSAFGDVADASPQDQAAMAWLVGWFENGSFSYSLDAPDGDGANNLEVIGDFLERRSGYCTHYATSLAVLGRLLGVPTRVAIGYSGADKTREGYIVSNQYLHAWCEAYLEGIGWVSFDVTPGYGEAASTSTPNAGASLGSTSVTSDYGSTLDATADGQSSSATGSASDSASATSQDGSDAQADGDGSDSSDQASGDPFEAVTTALVAAGNALRRSAPALVLLALALLTLAAPLLVRHRRRSKRVAAIREGKPAPHSAAWDELCDRARDTGVTWPASATEPQIAEVIAASLAPNQADLARALARNACAERYGARPSAPPEPESTLAALEDLARSLRPASRLARLRAVLLPRSVLHTRPGGQTPSAT